jgi:hypothetical protein
LSGKAVASVEENNVSLALIVGRLWQQEGGNVSVPSVKKHFNGKALVRQL